MSYPKFEDLTKEQQATFGNGCGVSWMPECLTAILFSWFDTADCRHHDFGYIVGGDEKRRWHCDWQFLYAMLDDVGKKTTFKRICYLALAVIFYVVLVGTGWLKFRYGTALTIEQAIEYDLLDKK